MTAYVTDFDNEYVYVIDVATSAVSQAISNPSFNQPYGVAVAPNGETVYVTDPSASKLYAIDTTTNTVIWSVAQTFPFGIAIIPDGTLSYVAATGAQQVEVINITNNTVSGIVTNAFTPFEAPFAVATFGPLPTPSILPPSNLTGFQGVNKFPFQRVYYNKIFWDASPTSAIVGYHIYRNNQLAGSNPASDLQFTDPSVGKSTSAQYAIKAYDSNGVESSAVTITIP